MKRTMYLILAAVLCISLCSCGSKEPEGPPEPTEWVISTEYITQRVTEFAASEELKFLQDSYEALVDYHGNDKTYGPYLTGAAEVYALRDDGKGQHYILMGIEGDMQLAIDTYADRTQVVYDIDSGSYYDSLSCNRAELQDHYTPIKGTAIDITINGGSNYQEALENIPRTFGGDSRFPGYVFTRELTADEVTSINKALRLEPIPPRGIGARPELNTTPEELRRITVDTVKQLAGRELYYKLYPNCDAPSVSAAIEFAEDISLKMHCLIIELADADTSGGEKGKLVVDMKTGIVYDDDTFVEYDETVDNPVKAASLLAEASMWVFGGQEEFLWSNAVESNRILDESEIKTINGELAEYFSENPIAPLPTEPPMETATEAAPDEEGIPAAEEQSPETGDKKPQQNVSNQFLMDALQNIQKTEHYQMYADESSAIVLKAAYEYYLEDFEGFEVHLLMLRVDGVDTNLYGFSSNVFLVNPATGEIYSEYDLGLDFTGNIGSIQDAYVAILCSSFWMGDDTVIWSDMEQITTLSQTDVDAINQARK